MMRRPRTVLRGVQGPAGKQQVRRRGRCRRGRPRRVSLVFPALTFSSNKELSRRVLPRQADEFTPCSRCFLVHHRSQLAKEVKGELICKECAA